MLQELINPFKIHVLFQFYSIQQSRVALFWAFINNEAIFLTF